MFRRLRRRPRPQPTAPRDAGHDRGRGRVSRLGRRCRRRARARPRRNRYRHMDRRCVGLDRPRRTSPRGATSSCPEDHRATARGARRLAELHRNAAGGFEEVEPCRSMLCMTGCVLEPSIERVVHGRNLDTGWVHAVKRAQYLRDDRDRGLVVARRERGSRDQTHQQQRRERLVDIDQSRPRRSLPMPRVPPLPSLPHGTFRGA